jgi:hypothetical protein
MGAQFLPTQTSNAFWAHLSCLQLTECTGWSRNTVNERPTAGKVDQMMYQLRYEKKNCEWATYDASCIRGVDAHPLNPNVLTITVETDKTFKTAVKHMHFEIELVRDQLVGALREVLEVQQQHPT